MKTFLARFRKPISKTRIAILIIFSFFLLVSCDNNQESNSSAQREEQEDNNRIAENYNVSQPIPFFPWSQLRQNLIEIESAQANTTITTSFFFNLGSNTPLNGCPSLGYPLPTTSQLSNPYQVVIPDVTGENNTAVVVGQIEPTGVFTGDSSGTYIMCVNEDGTASPWYWEGYVMTTPCIAEFSEGYVHCTEDPTVNVVIGNED